MATMEVVKGTWLMFGRCVGDGEVWSASFDF